MNTTEINCPECNATITVEAGLYQKAKSELAQDYKIREEKLLKAEAEKAAHANEELRKEMEKSYATRMKTENELFERQLKDAAEKSAALQAQIIAEKSKADDLVQKTRELELEKMRAEKTFAHQQELLDVQKKSIEMEIEKRAAARTNEEIKTKVLQLEEKEKAARKLSEESAARSIEALKAQQETEQLRQNMALEIQRRAKDEADRLRESLVATFQEEQRLKDKQYDQEKKIMLRQIEDLHKKAEQKSQQHQGEVFQSNFEDLLRESFGTDEIDPVSTGQRGADALQRVVSSNRRSGKILWETKDAKWNPAWLDKAKADQTDAAADHVVIVSLQMPKSVTTFAPINGVWVTSYSCAIALGMALRQGLIAAAKHAAALDGALLNNTQLTKYHLGPEYRNLTESQGRKLIEMSKDLTKERLAAERSFSRRAKQIDSVMLNLARGYGNVQGIIGQSLPDIPCLSLPDNSLEAIDAPKNADTITEEPTDHVAQPGWNTVDEEVPF